MDYDDNDISHRNLQLAGEGRSRSSSVLRPYDFPKFDFDDSLQAQLRFDSLDETEVFLGIQSQEDNQWIEDFSRGSNGMEFNSPPADPCSISRRNNVWSEATSSESVEMLLKSVGQEDIMAGESFIPDSNACHDQDTLVEHVESDSELDTKNDESPANYEATSAQDRHLKDYPVSKELVQDQLPEAEEPPVTQENMESISGTSTYDGKLSYHENLKESKTSAEKSMNYEAGDDSLHFTGAVGNVNFNLGMVVEQVNVNVSRESCDDDGQGKHVCSGTGQEDSKILEGMTGEASIPIHTVEGSLGLLAESGVLNSLDDVKESHVCVRETADIANNGGSELKSSKGDGKNVSFTTYQTDKHEVEVSPINSEMSGSFEDCRDASAVDGTEQHSAELASLNAGHCVSPVHKIDSSVLITCRRDNDEVKEVQESASKDETKASTSSDVVVLSSAPESSADENKETENVEGCRSDSLVTIEESCADLPAAVMDDSKQGIEENVAHSLAGFSESEQDICITKEDGKQLSTDAGNVGLETLTSDQRSQSLDVSIGVKENDVSPHAKSNMSTEHDDNTEKGKREPAVFELSHLDNDHKEAAAGIVSDANFRTEVFSVSKVESVADDAVRTPPSVVAAKSPQTLEKGNDISSSESPSTGAISSLYSNHSQVHLGGDKSSLKESVNADLVCGENHEVTMMKVEIEKESAQAADVDKVSCGSPTIISSSEASLMEKDNQDEARGSEVREQFVKDVQSPSENPKIKDATEDDTNFTFKINALPDTAEKKHARSWSSFPTAKKSSSTVVVEEIKLSGGRKTGTAKTPTQKTPRQNARVSDGEHLPVTSKGTSERRGRRASAKGMAKENPKKGNQVKDTNQESVLDNISTSLLSASSSGPNVQFEKVKPYGHVEQSNTKLSGAAAVPDLNTSALNDRNSPSASFHQPFTDLQQVQLRAQIFVYGSLIQGTVPDEACMVSAFLPSDGRSIWEPVWRASVERLRNQKSNSGTAETPLHSESGAKAFDAAVKQGSHSSKVLSSPVAQASSKSTPAAVVHPIIPLSSPLWSISTPLCDSLPSSSMHKGSIVNYQHTVTPLHSYQTPPMRNFSGHTSWPSQPCFPGPWLGSPRTSTFNSSVCYQPVTMTETVKITPVKDTSGQLTSGMNYVTSSSPVQTTAPSPVYLGVSLLPDPKLIVSAERQSVDSKPRKRKKVQASDPSQVPLLSEARTQPVADLNVATIATSPVVFPASASPVSNAVLSKAAVDAIAVCSAVQSKEVDLDAGKAVTCSGETLSKVAEAKSQAEDAATLAAAAVSNSEDLWRQLAKQKESGLTLEIEVKLASAAVAVAAAASVAKAAAAAAKVAYNVALQAKLMADEAFLSGKTSGLVPSSGNYSSDVHDIGNATATSILKGDNITNQGSSILVAAKEAAKRRVEAASAASKQAENLDAIVKAAELAATAVSQAGKIVAMGEPMPLRDLIEAGPDGYCKLTQPTSMLAEKLRDNNKGAAGVEDGDDITAKGSREDSVRKGGVESVGHGMVHTRDESLVDGIIHSVHTSESDLRSGKGCKASDTAKSSRLLSEPDASPVTGCMQNDHDELESALPEDNIKEGSSVEVFKRGDCLKSSWYSANVLTLEDGQAYVSYTVLSSEEGSGNLREWIPLGGEGDKAPVIRAAHPLIALQSQGTRKRRRDALGDYTWCVGDRVDAWVDDCWWEGVVTEKSEKDETTLKVHFPAQGETSTVRAWNLRASRSWNDGKWVQWSSSKGRDASEQSDTPQEKRQKLGSPIPIPSRGKDKLENDVDFASGKPEETKLLDLSTSDRIFNVGSKTTKEDKCTARKPLRSGLQKEGSRVIFGVPKPTGKKRKFMEVSKHFPTNRSDKSNETNDSVKFAKYLMPQATAARGWKVPSRNVSKEKRTSESRSTVPSSRKSNRTLPQRDNLNSKVAPLPLNRDKNNLTDRGKDIEDSVGHDEDTSDKLEHGSSASEEGAEAPLSSLISQSLSTSLKKVSSSNVKSVRVNRGKIAPSGGKLSKIEEHKVYAGNSGQPVTEVSEPRRSNRRIQPTHRLLEGLQSSMIILKMTSVSHDKGQKNPSRNVSTRGK